MENSKYETMEKAQLIRIIREKEEKQRLRNQRTYEKIKEKQKQKYQEKKEYYNCECGSKVLTTSKASHLNSEKHRKNLTNKDVREEILKEKPKCRLCKKPIVAFGSYRKNGADRLDFDNRPYHLKCYKDLEVVERLKDIVRKQKEDELYD